MAESLDLTFPFKISGLIIVACSHFHFPAGFFLRNKTAVIFLMIQPDSKRLVYPDHYKLQIILF